MEIAGLFDKVLSAVLLAAGILSFRLVYIDFGAAVGPDGRGIPSAAIMVHLAIFLILGLVSVIVAWRLWARPAPGRNAEPAAPLFGRGGKTPVIQSGRPRILLYTVPVIAVAALAADRFGPWRDPGGGGENASEQAEAAPPKPVNSVEPAPAEVVATTPEPVAPEPATPEPVAPKPEVPISADSPDEAVVPPPPPAPTVNDPAWPELVSAPELASPPPIEAQPAPPVATPQQPQTTTAPMPQPVALPTQADGHSDGVVWLALAPDGHSIMSASIDHTIKLWDMDGKKLIRNVGQHKDMARTALFLPDGKRALTSGDDGEMVLWSLDTGEVLHVFSATEHGGANKIALSADGKRAVSVHQAGTVIAWDIDKGTVLHVMTGHDWSISGVAMSPDGTRAISGSIDGALKLWNLDSGRLLRTWRGHERGTYGAAFSADGRYAFTGSGDTLIKQWDVTTGKEVRRFEGHSGTVYALALSSDGKKLLSGSLDGTARVWEVATGNELVQFVNQASIYAVAFTANGDVLTSGNDRAIKVWPAAGGDSQVLFAGAPG